MSDKLEEPQTSVSANETAGSGYGFLLCISAEVFYVVSNTLLRWMTEFQQVSSDWTLMVKETVTVTAVAPIMIFYMLRGQYRFPSWKTFGFLLAGSVFCELIGARFHLWSYAVIGIVLAMPLIQIFTLLGVAGLGSVSLGEKMSPLKMAAMLVLVAAIGVLAWSQLYLTQDANTAVAATTPLPVTTVLPADTTLPAATALPDTAVSEGSPSAFSLHAITTRIPASWRFSFGLTLCLLTGLGYALYMLCLRRAMKNSVCVNGKMVGEVPLTFSMFTVCGVGVLVGAGFLYGERGLGEFWNVPAPCWYITLGSGIVNLIGFYFRNLGFRHVTASKQAFVSTFQIMSLAILGVIFFGEPTNLLLWIGIVMTGVGIIMAGFTR
ncbi:MAG: EamA family transporter [Thermoguttaceae bacterium]|nr:EamA family transporter [Thermoguttaceae bacterium]